MVDCKHWTSRQGVGQCSLGLYGGKPSVGVCTKICQQRVSDPSKASAPVPLPPNAVQPPAWGPLLWSEIHRRYITAADKTWDAYAELAWLYGSFSPRVRQCGDCLAHWLAHLSSHPVNLSSPDAAFAWSVEAHNHINRRRGVAVITLDAARRRWSDMALSVIHDPADLMETCRTCVQRYATAHLIRDYGPNHDRSLAARPCRAGDGKGTCGSHAAAQICPLGLFPHQAAERAAALQSEAPRGDGAASVAGPAGKGLPLYINDGQPIHIQNLYRGRPAFLIAGGPSFLSLDHAPLNEPGALVMSVNNYVKHVRPTLWTCVDNPDHFLRSIFEDARITKFVPMGMSRSTVFDSTTWTRTDRMVRDCPNVMFYKRNADYDAAKFLTGDTANWGRPENKGGPRDCMLVAMRLLYELGVRDVFLLGVDYSMNPEKAYSIDEGKDEKAARSNNNRYKRLNEMYRELRPHFERAGFRVHNCNPDSKMTAFDYVPYEEAVKFSRASFGVTSIAAEPTANLYKAGKPTRVVAVPHPKLTPRSMTAPGFETPNDFDVTIITPTGDRPACFALCERWMAKQTYQGRVQWIVTDDGADPTVPTMGQLCLRRERKSDDPPHTLPVNLAIALAHVRAPKVLIIEDDDYYAPAYVQTMVDALDRDELVGITHIIYYLINPPHVKNMGNHSGASLACTGVSGRGLGLLHRATADTSDPFVDRRLWQVPFEGRKRRIRLNPANPIALQIKGMPGRAGQLKHHRPVRGYRPDPDLSRLHELIGDDADAYAPFSTTMRIAYVYTRKTPNIGDHACCPADYFDLGDGDRRDLGREMNLRDRVVIVGGGGLLGEPASPRLLRLLNSKPKVAIGWGIGLNHTSQTIPPWAAQFDLLGTREWNIGHRWVPCVSCMSPLFDVRREPRHPAVLYTHHHHRGLPLRGELPSMSNAGSTINEVIDHLASAEIVITDSYHGAYWAILLGRRVVVYPWVTARACVKFDRMRFSPAIARGGEEWQEAAARAVRYNNALAVCRDANRLFFADVQAFLSDRHDRRDSPAVVVPSATVEPERDDPVSIRRQGALCAD
jgi:hypothetical protein